MAEILGKLPPLAAGGSSAPTTQPLPASSRMGQDCSPLRQWQIVVSVAFKRNMPIFASSNRTQKEVHQVSLDCHLGDSVEDSTAALVAESVMVVGFPAGASLVVSREVACLAAHMVGIVWSVEWHCRFYVYSTP